MSETEIVIGYWKNGDVQIDTTADVGPLAVLCGPIAIGPRTRIMPHATIGLDGEHRRAGPVGRILIGADVVIREGVAVQRGTGDRETSIGDRCYVMHGAHVSHDTTLAEDVTLSPNVVLGGHTRVHRGATIGIGAMTHQHTTIGAYAMIGMGAVVTRDVPPFALVVGNPARFVRWNTHPLAALGLTLADLAEGSTHPLVVEARAAFDADSRRERMRGAP